MSHRGKRTSSAGRSAEATTTAGAVELPFPAAFIVLVAATASAPLVATHVHPSDADLGLEGGATGLVLFGVLILLAFTLALLGAVRRGELLIPRSPLLVAAGLMVAGTAVSSLAAADRHRALVASVEVILGVMYFVTALAVTKGRHAVRWLIAAVVAGAAAAALVALLNRWQTPPEELAKYFDAHRQEILSRMNVAAGSAEEEMYRRRFDDFQGPFYHPNLLASYLTMGILLALGLVIGHVRGAWARTTPFEVEKGSAAAVARDRLVPAVRQRPHTMLGSAVVVLCVTVMVAALVMTRGRAAMLATAGGFYLMLVLGLAPTRWAKVALLVIPAVLGAALVTVVLQMNLLPSVTSRLEFQADYLRGAWAMIADHPWLGVGPDNFGHYYLQYKMARAPEQIDHPHCWPLWAWASMGLAGLVGLVSLLGLGLREAGRHMTPACEPPQQDRQVIRGLVGVMVLVAGVVVVFALRGSGNEEGAGLAAAIKIFSSLGSVLAPLLAVIILGHEADQSLWNIGRKWTRRALLAALAAFWLDGLMSLSMPHLPTTMAAYAIIALLAATGQDQRWIRVAIDRRRRSVLSAAVLLAVVAYVVWVVLPVVGSAWSVSEARSYPPTSQEYRDRVQAAADRATAWSYPYELLADSDWLAARDARQGEQQMLQQAEKAGLETPRGQQLVLSARAANDFAWERLTAAIRELDEAVIRSPHHAGLSHKTALALVELAELHGTQEDREQARQRALGEMQRSVDLNPTEAQWRVEYLEWLKRWGREDEAVRQAREAIRLDDAMNDPLRKLTSAERARCETLVRQSTE